MHARVLSVERCEQCDAARIALELARERIRNFESEIDAIRDQLRETTKLVELQRGDVERYKKAYEAVRPNCPERVAVDQLQLAFERVLASVSEDLAKRAAAATTSKPSDQNASAGSGTSQKKDGRHGRRRLDISNLPVERVQIDPDDVIADREGFERIGEEVSERLAFRRGGYVRIQIVRTKWARIDDEAQGPIIDVGVASKAASELSPIVVAPLPESVWPNFMADPSAVAQVIISKYDDCLPLHRQERISGRNGFVVPRSTQCGWLTAAYDLCYRIVDAMFAEAKVHAFCIATDATGAPVQPETGGPCENWHIFVFIADRDHVVFRFSDMHTSATIEDMLHGFRGRLLADASLIYDVLFREHGIIEIACWYHLRRYAWRALDADRHLALEALSIISQLFKVQHECLSIPMPERTAIRAERAKPILDLFDVWADKNRGRVDSRGPLEAAIGYYDNQRQALHRFLEDGRLRLDNSISEQQLRNAKLGCHNWTRFENETGIRWYTTFRSLIASCALHGLNAQEYIEQLLRLAPHWPVTRVLELSPKYWARTVERLDDRHREILKPPWENAARASGPAADAA